jgi:CMP-N-acetylneuraminate monooxygenase
MNKSHMKFHLGSILKNELTALEHHIPIPLGDGFSENGDFIVGRVNGKWIAYDRICDHNGGLLCLDKDKATATCKMHKWTLLLSDATYENKCHKKTLPVREEDGVLVITSSVERFPSVKTSELTDAAIDLFFNAHASVSLNCAGLLLTTDPWLVGSCFATGWWHAYPPSTEAIERLKQSSCIYISHNHPDHLHMPTLEAYVAKSQLFLIPAFESRSVETILRRHGFNNLIVADFMQEVTFQAPTGDVRTMLVRAGDGRDDSSLLVFTRDDTIFFGVDTNMPNRWVLPRVDVLFTPFASGATGFPSRIANFSHERKIEIITANRASVLTNHVAKLVKATRPKYVVPYAGYFTEASRDQDVKSINQKNSAADLVSFVETNFQGVRAINPLDTPVFTLEKGELTTKEVLEMPSYFLDGDYISDDIRRFTAGAPKLDIDQLKSLGRNLVASCFTDDLTVIFVPSDDGFAPTLNQALAVDFSANFREWRLVPVEGKDDFTLASSLSDTTNNIEILRIRSDVMATAISCGLPLEDISIGFQILMYRQPNVYNFKFWDHFTNTEFIVV